MSTLTKVLIVLLSVFSLFLCGVVVTYVANANNYKETADTQRRDVQVAENRQRDAEDELAKYKTAAEQTQQDLEQQLSDMQVNLNSLQAQLTDVKLENSRLVQQMANSNATVTATSKTQAELLEHAQAAQTRVKDLEAAQTRLETQLKETNQTLLDKMAIIDTLQAKNNQLVEANQELESRTNQYLQTYGRIAAAPQPVTQPRSVAQPAEPTTRQIDLDGRVVKVDMPLAQISIGSVVGVRENMQFYVTRGDQFIANLTIQWVNPETAVGTLSQVQSTPRTGDTITTNL